LIGNDSPKKAVLREAFDVILISLFLNPTVFTLLFFLQPWKDYRYKLEGKFGALTQLEEATPRGVEECVVPTRGDLYYFPVFCCFLLLLFSLVVQNILVSKEYH
jgi:hypothetical protein